jgi:DNA-binding transcriptional LysR family regulator
MPDAAGDMAAFVRVVEAKGFSAAAIQLDLSPSAVSKLITRLEARLGVRLLQRTTRRLRLTAEGEAFYESARRIVGEIAALESQIGDRSGMPRGLLRVTAPLTFSRHQLAPLVGEFLQRCPAIRLELLPTDRVLDIVEEGIDVAVRIGRLADTSFMARKIGEDRRILCAAPRYLAQHPALRRPDDLVRHACIVPREPAAARRWPFRVAGVLRETEVDGPIAVGEAEAQLELALQGVGIVRLTRLTVAQAVHDGRLVPLLEDFSADQPVPIHAVYPHRRHLAPKVSVFVDFLIEKFTPPPWVS